MTGKFFFVLHQQSSSSELAPMRNISGVQPVSPSVSLMMTRYVSACFVVRSRLRLSARRGVRCGARSRESLRTSSRRRERCVRSNFAGGRFDDVRARFQREIARAPHVIVTAQFARFENHFQVHVDRKRFSPRRFRRTRVADGRRETRRDRSPCRSHRRRLNCRLRVRELHFKGRKPAGKRGCHGGDFYRRSA